jgi:tRNA threonylcarbamoyladenosine biosynthesis protein TsaE
MPTIHSPEDMHKLWREIAKTHKIILLEGELWSGKTTFIKWFAEGLWIDHKQVQSPTYTYIKTYENKILHIDMRRIQDAKELIEKGIIDQIHQYEYIAIERPKYTEILWIKFATKIIIKKTSPTEREVSIEQTKL